MVRCTTRIVINTYYCRQAWDCCNRLLSSVGQEDWLQCWSGDMLGIWRSHTIEAGVKTYHLLLVTFGDNFFSITHSFTMKFWSMICKWISPLSLLSQGTVISECPRFYVKMWSISGDHYSYSYDCPGPVKQPWRLWVNHLYEKPLQHFQNKTKHIRTTCRLYRMQTNTLYFQLRYLAERITYGDKRPPFHCLHVHCDRDMTGKWFSKSYANAF